MAQSVCGLPFVAAAEPDGVVAIRPNHSNVLLQLNKKNNSVYFCCVSIHQRQIRNNYSANLKAYLWNLLMETLLMTLLLSLNISLNGLSR